MQSSSNQPGSSRRTFMRTTSSVTLSAAGVMLLGGRDAYAMDDKGTMSSDLAILNVALGLEHQGIAAYTLGAKSGLLQKPVLAVATKFQDDHKVHRDLLAEAILKMGGTPVKEKTLDEYAKALNAASLKSQEDILKLAASLELGATNAYLGVIPSFKDGQLAKVAARLAADEVAHWAILNNTLNLPLPKAMIFGA